MSFTRVKLGIYHPPVVAVPCPPPTRRELTEAKEAQRKAVSELSAARDAQEKVGGWLGKKTAAVGRFDPLETVLFLKLDHWGNRVDTSQ